MKILITGYTKTDMHYADFKLRLDKILKQLDPNEITIIHGGEEKGVDLLSEQYANEHHYPVKGYKINWDEDGKQAAYTRNEKMTSQCTHAVLFTSDDTDIGFLNLKHCCEANEVRTIIVRIPFLHC